jgi:hypothetical protein
MFGLAVLVKQHGALFSIFAVLMVLFAWGSARAPKWRERIVDALILSAGIAAPIVLTGLAIAWAGLFPKFWFWTIVYARQYIEILSPKEAWASFLQQAPQAMAGWTWAVLATAVGAIILIRKRDLAPVRSVLLWFFLFSFLSVCPGFYFRNHYFITMIPAMALLVGLAASTLATFLNHRWHLPLGGVAVFAVVMLLPLAIFSSEFFYYSNSDLSRTDYPYACFTEMKAIGDHLKAVMRPGDTLAVLGSEPELFFYAHCRSASGYLYTYPLMEPQPFADQMQKDMIAEIQSNNPRFMVVVGNNSSWLQRVNSNPFIFIWMQQFIKKSYHLVGAVQGVTGTPVEAQPRMFLWERNGPDSGKH